MSSNPNIIAAIEIGSSKINGIVAEVSADGSRIKVLFQDSMPISDSVRHGRIQNVMEVSHDFSLMLRKLENAPGVAPRRISGLYLGIGGRSLTSMPAQANAGFSGTVEISATTLQNLSHDASFGLAHDKDIFAMLPRRFTLDGAEVKKVIGSLCQKIHADYSAVVASPVLKRNLECVKPEDGRKLERAYLVAPLALADLVLPDADKQIGVILADFGDQTVTLSAYKNGALQWLRTLPFGSKTISNDLMAVLNVTEEHAREIKHTTASATGPTDRDDTQTADINDCVSGRASEIVANIENVIDSCTPETPQRPGEGEKSKMLQYPCGIVLAGGGAKLKNFDTLLSQQTRSKVRLANITDNVSVTGLTADPYMILDVIALAMAAGKNGSVTCFSEPQTAAPRNESDYEQAEEERYESPRDNYRPHQGGFRRNIDEDDENLLLDDDDDETPRKRRKPRADNPKPRKQPKVREREEVDDDDFDDEEEGPTPSKPGWTDKLKNRFIKIFTTEPNDDLDEE